MSLYGDAAADMMSRHVASSDDVDEYGDANMNYVMLREDNMSSIMLLRWRGAMRCYAI